LRGRTMLRFGDKSIRRRIERDGRFAQKLMAVRKDGAVLGFAAVGVKDTQAGRGGKQKVDTLERNAGVVERGGGIAGLRLPREVGWCGQPTAPGRRLWGPPGMCRRNR
jgi:hypothetical protein